MRLWTGLTRREWLMMSDCWFVPITHGHYAWLASSLISLPRKTLFCAENVPFFPICCVLISWNIVFSFSSYGLFIVGGTLTNVSLQAVHTCAAHIVDPYNYQCLAARVPTASRPRRPYPASTAHPSHLSRPWYRHPRPTKIWRRPLRPP